MFFSKLKERTHSIFFSIKGIPNPSTYWPPPLYQPPCMGTRGILGVTRGDTRGGKLPLANFHLKEEGWGVYPSSTFDLKEEGERDYSLPLLISKKKGGGDNIPTPLISQKKGECLPYATFDLKPEGGGATLRHI